MILLSSPNLEAERTFSMVVDTEKDAQNRANNYLVFIFGKDDNVSFDEEVEKRRQLTSYYHSKTPI